MKTMKEAMVEGVLIALRDITAQKYAEVTQIGDIDSPEQREAFLEWVMAEVETAQMMLKVIKNYLRDEEIIE